MHSKTVTADRFWHDFSIKTHGVRWALIVTPGGESRWQSLVAGRASVSPSQVIIVDSPAWSAADAPLPDVELVVAFGGGFVIDAAKQITSRLLAANLRSSQSGPQIVAIPTISGSGSEVTPFATTWVAGRKSSIEDPRLCPTVLFLVPEFAIGAPTDKALAAALDALSHALEAVWNVRATPASDENAAAAIATLVPLLSSLSRRHLQVGEQARLMMASAQAGQAIAQTRTALAHSISYPVTGELGLPHGIASSFALPQIARFNLAADALRLRPIACALGCETEDIPEVLQEILKNCLLPKHFAIPRPEAINGLRGQLTGSTRAANNIRQADEVEARHLAALSLEKIHAS